MKPEVPLAVGGQEELCQDYVVDKVSEGKSSHVHVVAGCISSIPKAIMNSGPCQRL